MTLIIKNKHFFLSSNRVPRDVNCCGPICRLPVDENFLIEIGLVYLQELEKKIFEVVFDYP